MYGDSAAIVSVTAAGRPANTWHANIARGIPTPSSAMVFAFDFLGDRRISASTSTKSCILDSTPVDFAFLCVLGVLCGEIRKAQHRVRRESQRAAEKSAAV